MSKSRRYFVEIRDDDDFVPDKEDPADLFDISSRIPHGPHTLWELRSVLRLAKTIGYEGNRYDPSLLIYREDLKGKLAGNDC